MTVRTIEHYENQINLLRQRVGMVNMKLINKLERRKKTLESKVNKS